MVAVIDASVLAKLFLPELGSDLAERVVSSHRIIFVPDLACIEVASALLRAHRNATVSEEFARSQLVAWRQFTELGSVRLVPFGELLMQAEDLSMQLRHPLADCLYLALAAQRDIPLVTADKPFVEKAADVYPTVQFLFNLDS